MTLSTWFLAAWLLFASTPAKTYLLDGVAVVVGNQIILVSDLRMKMTPYLTQVCQMPSGPDRDRALEDIWAEAMKDEIANVLMELEAQKHNIYVDSTELDATIEMLVRQNRFQSLQQLREKLEEQNYPYLQWRKDVRRQLLRSRLLNEVVKLSVNVEEQAIRSYYQQKVREANAEERVFIRELYIPDKDATPTLLQTIANEIKKGTSFETLVKAYSRARSATTGGLRTDITRGMYAPAVDQMLFPVHGKIPQEGTILGPIRTASGIWYIEVLERIESGYLPYEQVRDKLKEELTSSLLQQKGMEWLLSLKNKYLVDRQMPKPPRIYFCR